MVLLYLSLFITLKRYLNKNAIVIQKNWRGYLGRRKYRNVLEERLIQMRFDFYNEKACLVAKIY